MKTILSCLVLLCACITLSACFRPDWQINDPRIEHFQASVTPDATYYAKQAGMKKYYAR